MMTVREWFRVQRGAIARRPNDWLWWNTTNVAAAITEGRDPAEVPLRGVRWVQLADLRREELLAQIRQQMESALLGLAREELLRAIDRADLFA